ncbi:MAG: hypothetical protein CK547_02395 [Chitinophagaceae bacterium]|nr:MAG: hypothetical protein CK547_02395 [Chitinophagaceae bacterium]
MIIQNKYTVLSRFIHREVHGSLKLGFMAMLVLILQSCTKTVTKPFQTIKGDPTEQLALWKERNISNYEMTMKIYCFCIQGRVGPHHIVVENDQIKTVNDLPYDSTKTGPIQTINELYDIIEMGLASNPYNHSLEYNSIYNYPQKIYFDFSEQIADEEVGYEITEFKVL